MTFHAPLDCNRSSPDPDSCNDTTTTSTRNRRRSLPFKKRGHALDPIEALDTDTPPCTGDGDGDGIVALDGIAWYADGCGENPNPVRRNSQDVLLEETKSSSTGTASITTAVATASDSSGIARTRIRSSKRKNKGKARSAGKSNANTGIKRQRSVSATTTTATKAKSHHTKGGGKAKKRGYTRQGATEDGHKTGRWSLDEQKAFLRGLEEYGKGKWSRISKDIPSRDTTQVKTHAQVVLKRWNNGSDIFALLNSPPDSDPPPRKKKNKEKLKESTRKRAANDSHFVASAEMHMDSDADALKDRGFFFRSPVTLVQTNINDKDAENRKNFFSPLPERDISFPTNFGSNHHNHSGTSMSASAASNANSNSIHRTPNYMPPVKNLHASSSSFPPLLNPNPFAYDCTPLAPPMESYLYNFAVPDTSTQIAATATNIHTTSATTSIATATANTTNTATLTTKYSRIAEDMENRSSAAKILIEMASPRTPSYVAQIHLRRDHYQYVHSPPICVVPI